MKKLIQVEFLKLHKRRLFLFILLFNSVAFLYALGIYFHWSWVSIVGEFDLIQFTGAIWQLLFLIGIPLILFMYVGASLIGSERIEGQILLEVTRVADRGRLIFAKFTAMLGIILFYFLSNLIITIVSYALIVRNTNYASKEWIILDSDNKSLIFSSLAVLFYLILSVFVVMSISVTKSAIVSTISGIVLYVLLTLTTRISGIQEWVPGYLALNSSANINLVSIVYQLLASLLISYLAVLFACNRFKKIDL
jgi:ABC-2 type transport system permease protein